MSFTLVGRDIWEVIFESNGVLTVRGLGAEKILDDTTLRASLQQLGTQAFFAFQVVKLDASVPEGLIVLAKAHVREQALETLETFPDAFLVTQSRKPTDLRAYVGSSGGHIHFPHFVQG